MKRDKTRDPKINSKAKKRRGHPSRVHPEDPLKRICWRKHEWDTRTHKHCPRCQYIRNRNYQGTIKKDQVDKWGLPERGELVTRAKWVINARKLFQAYLDCWARDEQNGWYLRKEKLADLQEIREQAGVMLWTKLNRSFSPKKEMTPELEAWLDEPVRRHTDA